ncbi:MAG: hypothetical protein QOI12_158 [Alphaproteobacteria bacterium]|jgi:hypothetical protein|nr:hypothetical protein [Alphaproteobacteria bacterium]
MGKPLTKDKANKMGTTHKQNSCELRIRHHLEGRFSDLQRLWTAYRDGDEECNSDLGTLHEYGLCFDYVAPGTFDNQAEGYFRYQLSWGGPSDEFRFFVNPDLSCHRVEYWFLDWFDGAHRNMTGEYFTLLAQIWEWFRETGTAQAALRTARA